MRNTGFAQYMRQYRLVIKKKDADVGLEITGLRCTFSIQKAVSDAPDYSVVTIYNPSEKMKGEGASNGDTVILEAGYKDGNYGMIFMGQVVQTTLFRESQVDTALKLVCQDGDEFLKAAFVMKTVGRGSTPYDVVNMCIDGRDGVQRGVIASSMSMARLPRGKVMFGKKSKYLKAAARKNQCQFYIEDGKVNIVAAEGYGSEKAVVLNPETGLIGMPEQTDDGVKGQCLINPSIKLNTRIYINSGDVNAMQDTIDQEGKRTHHAMNTNGIYKIVKLAYEGDTHGDQWYCSFEAVTQSGEKPDGLRGNATNPWH